MFNVGKNTSFVGFKKNMKEQYDSDDDDTDNTDLFSKFQKKVYKNNVVCQAQYEQKVCLQIFLNVEIC